MDKQEFINTLIGFKADIDNIISKIDRDINIEALRSLDKLSTEATNLYNNFSNFIHNK